MFDTGTTTPKRNVTLYTSLPRQTERTAAGKEIGPAYQRACIASWRGLGFDVVSLNSRPEIDALAEFDYDVRFHEVSSERPRIIDFFRLIQNSPAPLAGITNADCLLLANEAIVTSILKAAESGLVMLERMNLRAENAQVTGIPCYGFDFFFFPKEALRCLKFDTETSIGTPWWDYWFPLSHRQAGGKLYSVPAPLLMHVDHTHNWSHERWALQGKRMHAALSIHPEAPVVFPFIKYGYDGDFSDMEVASLAEAAFQWLRRTPTPIEVTEPFGSFLLAVLAGLDEVPKMLIERDRMLRESNEKLRAIEESIPRRILWALRGLARSLGFARDDREKLD